MLLLGFASSVLGVLSTYAFPSTRADGITPLVLTQVIAIFGGIVAMLCGAYAMDSENARDANAKLQEAVRFHVALVILLALANGFDVPFGPVLPFLLAGKLNAALKPMWRWLGRV